MARPQPLFRFYAGNFGNHPEAIGQGVLKNNPGAGVCYIPCEAFVHELINAIREDGMAAFRNKYNNTDVLLLDDIQFIAGKERTQEALYHSFNALYESNKQIVISSSRPPKQIPGLEEGLRSRFDGGIMVELQPPDLETRSAILIRMAQAANIRIPEEVVDFVAKLCSTSVRELEGALNRVVLYSKVKSCPISEETAREALM